MARYLDWIQHGGRVRWANGYLLPEQPGHSAQMHAQTLARFAFPRGAEWAITGATIPTAGYYGHSTDCLPRR